MDFDEMQLLSFKALSKMVGNPSAVATEILPLILSGSASLLKHRFSRELLLTNQYLARDPSDPAYIQAQPDASVNEWLQKEQTLQPRAIPLGKPSYLLEADYQHPEKMVLSVKFPLNRRFKQAANVGPAILLVLEGLSLYERNTHNAEMEWKIGGMVDWDPNQTYHGYRDSLRKSYDMFIATVKARKAQDEADDDPTSYWEPSPPTKAKGQAALTLNAGANKVKETAGTSGFRYLPTSVDQSSSNLDKFKDFTHEQLYAAEAPVDQPASSSEIAALEQSLQGILSLFIAGATTGSEKVKRAQFFADTAKAMATKVQTEIYSQQAAEIEHIRAQLSNLTDN